MGQAPYETSEALRIAKPGSEPFKRQKSLVASRLEQSAPEAEEGAGKSVRR